MTKLIQQLNFSSSNYYDVAGIEPPSAKPKIYNGEGASLNVCGGSKRSALSESDAECFSLCLGAGPLCKVFSIPGGPDVPAHSSAPPGGVNGGAASPATPSTPTHDDNHRDLLSALLWSSATSLSSAEATTPDAAHPSQDHTRTEATVEKILARKDRATKINFKVYLTEQNYTRWECVLKADVMYLRLPESLSAGSKEAFMFLLDFAEERLHCTHWIICVNKAREDRTTILRTFMFLGFQILPPNSPMAAEINNPDYLLMHYNYN